MGFRVYCLGVGFRVQCLRLRVESGDTADLIGNRSGSNILPLG